MSQLAKLVLENDLLLEFEKFKRGNKIDTAKIQALLHYYKPPHTLNKEQLDFLKNNDILVENDELSAFAQRGIFDLSLENLAKHTAFKIILSSDKADFPYVNVFGDKIENNFSATFHSQDNRMKAVKHFASLFNRVKEILIYDRYLKRQWLEYLITNCQIHINTKIIIVKTDKNFVKNLTANNCVVCNHTIDIIDGNSVSYTYSTTHDRYINIDNKMQIILTSGLQHLQRLPTDDRGNQIPKDFTYILREL